MKTGLKTLLTVCASLAVFQTNSLAQTIIIKANKVVTNTNLGVIDDGTILIKDGQVTAISTNANYDNDLTISGDNYWVTPGIFAAYTNLGLVEVNAVSSTNDTRAGDAKASLTLRASDSFNPHSTSIPVSRLGGITHAAIAPGSGKTIFGGQGMVTSTDGRLDFDDKRRFIFVQLGESGARTAGGSRSASVGYLRSALSDAANISTRYTRNADHGEVLNRYEAGTLNKALIGQIPILIGVDKATDILGILKLQRNRLDIIIVGASEGWMVADQLAAANVSVIIDPLENLPYGFEDLGSRLDNAKILQDAGVKMAFMTRTATGSGAQNIRLLPQHAGNAVANGLSWDAAFKAITLNPASMFGSKFLGQLQAGRRANLVVWDGDPLEITSTPIAIFIDGKRQDLTSRQTELRDRYHPNNTGNALYGYRP